MKANIMSNIKTHKHTPGPWQAYHECDGSIEVYAKHNGVITSVADVRRNVNDPHLDEEANGRLIAAAPDLLEALQACLLRDDIASDELGEMIRAAIAKVL